ncbi:recombinase family protein [Mucilaginibacter sp. HMF5004]|uniref:recombinase family protein n=1 Tax=Mucilaginibacter rivuli TaxID=2857527 RepID=UPI001C5FCEEB|nr:recombinase family protein [Mucilaginibacter rivuli]MBW4891136.1 recombinase family protein [Mucilaginibacter rivuli]
MNETKRVGIWIRVSTDMQVQGDSPEHHEQRAKHYIQLKEWEVAEVYRLDAISGKSVMGHSETKRMLADIKSGHITGLVFSKLARLARNTKELLEFAELFRASNADLISLAESIDTSSPAGRLFYTMIAAMAQWEREEIAARISASIPIRAKLGKFIGGKASLGYRWEDNQLVIDETEAPVRKLVYELFLKYKRKKTTAKALNELGHRTRDGNLFSDSTVLNLLRDPAAKGERRAAFSQTKGQGKSWVLKPESEWIRVPCPAIVSAELWNECNFIMDEQQKLRKKPGPKAVHLLSGYMKCACGKSMYVFHKSLIYVCRKCSTRIAVSDIDEIYQTYLKDYLSGIDSAQYLEQSDQELHEKKQLLDVVSKERAKLAKQVNTLVQLRMDGELAKERFKEQYDPLEERISQLDRQLPELEAEIDVRTITRLSSETVFAETRTLYEQWPNMPFEQKRSIVETITESIVIAKNEIVIRLAYEPPSMRNGGKRQSNNASAVMLIPLCLFSCLFCLNVVTF